MRTVLWWKMAASVLIVLGLSAGSCHERKGPAEKAGERIDEIADNVREGDPALKKKGAMERTGEAIDDAIGSNRE
jgi:hypothetical protein